LFSVSNNSDLKGGILSSLDLPSEGKKSSKKKAGDEEID